MTLIKKLQVLADMDGESMGFCVIEQNLANLKILGYNLVRDGVRYDGHTTKDGSENVLKRLELVLSTRLMDKQFRGIIDFQKAAIGQTSIEKMEKIQKALVS